MTTASVMVGRDVVGVMVWVPPTSAVAMLKLMRSAPPTPLAVLLAAVIIPSSRPSFAGDGRAERPARKRMKRRKTRSFDTHGIPS